MHGFVTIKRTSADNVYNVANEMKHFVRYEYGYTCETPVACL